MDDYVSRGDVLDIVSQYCPDDDGSCSKADVDPREMLDEIEALPSADVQLVKYGRWEVNGDRFYPFCSNCKYKPPKGLIRCNALSLEPILTKYCPNCGFENGTRIYRGGDSDE